MLKKILWMTVLILLISSNCSFASGRNIEIFDVSQGKVVKSFEARPPVEKEISIYLKGITGEFNKLKPIPRDGLMIKVPLNDFINVNNKWIKKLVDEVIVMLPENEAPYLMVFDIENRTYFFNFEGNMDRLFKLLDIKPASYFFDKNLLSCRINLQG